jgi:hypothetical protein
MSHLGCGHHYARSLLLDLRGWHRQFPVAVKNNIGVFQRLGYQSTQAYMKKCLQFSAEGSMIVSRHLFADSGAFQRSK